MQINNLFFQKRKQCICVFQKKDTKGRTSNDGKNNSNRHEKKDS
jgi:hypothetical protein